MRGLLLDMDGVLLDTTSLHTAAWAVALAPVGVAVDERMYLQLACGRSREDALRALAGEVPDAEAILRAKGEATVALVHAHPPTVRTGVHALLTSARRAGWRLAVATSSRLAPALLAVAGLSGFEAVVDRSMVAQGKPAPDLFLDAARRLGVSPDRCVVVEDSPAGVAAGRAAGCRVVAVRTSAPDAALAAAHLIVDGPGDVPLDLDPTSHLLLAES